MRFSSTRPGIRHEFRVHYPKVSGLISRGPKVLGIQDDLAKYVWTVLG